MRRLSSWSTATVSHWGWIFAGLVLLILLRNLADLGSVPLGYYNDEASIAYNAWTIGNFGTDEHGIGWPLFFKAFGEYKNPIYVYADVIPVKLLGATLFAERLPAAIFGAIAATVLGLTARRLTGSWRQASLVLLLAGASGWLVLQSRVGFEVVSYTAIVSVFVWLALGAIKVDRASYFLWSGVSLTAGIFAYATGRVEALAFVVVIAYVTVGKTRRWRWLLPPVIVGYAILALWSNQNPGALTAHFNGVSILSGGGITWIPKFFCNYFSYWNPVYLFTNGDSDARNHVPFGGMLLVATLPLLVFGIARLIRSRHELTSRFLLAGMLVSPVAASFTAEGTPHALRSVSMIPFLFAAIALGISEISGFAKDHRGWIAAWAVLLVAEVGFYHAFLFTDYANLSAASFDAGEAQTLVLAHSLAGGHQVLISDLVDQPYIQALVGYLPPPPGVADDSSYALAGLNMRSGTTAVLQATAGAGDVLVVLAGEGVTGHPVLVGEDSAQGQATEIAPGAGPTPGALVLIYRL